MRVLLKPVLGVHFIAVINRLTQTESFFSSFDSKGSIFFRSFNKTVCFISANLAVADLVIVVSMLMYPVELLESKVSTKKNFCIFRIGLSILSFAASSLTLIHISVDRFMAIVFPFKHFVDSRKMRIYYTIIVTIWITSLTFCLCLYWQGKHLEVRGISCTNGDFVGFELSVVMTCVIFLMMITIIVLYIGICFKLKHRKELPELSLPKNAHTNLMMFVYAGFIVCWLPIGVINVISYGNRLLHKDLVCVREYLTLLAYINSGMNWIIYGLANQKFRKAFVTILCRPCIPKLKRSVHVFSNS